MPEPILHFKPISFGWVTWMSQGDVIVRLPVVLREPILTLWQWRTLKLSLAVTVRLRERFSKERA